MTAPDTTTAEFSRLPQYSIYGPTKRFKRRVLRALGRWSRADYDVQIVYEDDRAAYKKITFNHPDVASQITHNLKRFGTSLHLPAWRKTDGCHLWVDYVGGQPYHHIETRQTEEIARCFVAFASHGSYRLPIEQTGYDRWHRDNLDFLGTHGLTDTHLARALDAQTARCQPTTLRLGFDYRDPIAPNLVQRADNGYFCAIDIKNWHADTLVGEGLAKATDRWLDSAFLTRILDEMRRRELADIADHFEYIRLYERCTRIRRRAETELKTFGRIKKRKTKIATLARLAD